MLISRRDDKLAARFYYYSTYKKSSFEDALANLAHEFDIDERVVMDRLKLNNDKVDAIFAIKPTITDLRRKFPYFVW